MIKKPKDYTWEDIINSSTLRHNSSEDLITVTPNSYKQILEKMFKYVPQEYIKKPVPVIAYRLHDHFEVLTPEGWVHGNPEDYLVINPDGSMYPSEREVFETNYVKYIRSEEHEPI